MTANTNWIIDASDTGNKCRKQKEDSCSVDITTIVREEKYDVTTDVTVNVLRSYLQLPNSKENGV